MRVHMTGWLGGLVALATVVWGAAMAAGFPSDATASPGSPTTAGQLSTIADSSEDFSFSATRDAPHDPAACDQPAPAATVQPADEGEPAMRQATFHLCGQADAQTARAIEQLIGGRPFSARLVSRADGCADLTISVSADATAASSSQQTTNLVVSTSAGGVSRTIAVHIVSENAQTRVTLAPTDTGA